MRRRPSADGDGDGGGVGDVTTLGGRIAVIRCCWVEQFQPLNQSWGE